MDLRHPPLFRHTAYALVLALPISAAAAVRTYDIPPQALSSALTAFADQSDTRLLFESAMTRGLKSRGASGTLSAEEALDRILAGTGLQHRRTADGAITLSKGAAALPVAAQDTGAALPKVTVTAKAAYQEDDPRSREYAASRSAAAMRMNTPIMETPISVEVIPQAVMRDQQAVQLGDVVKNVSGVFPGFTFGGFAEEFMIRGFNTAYNNYLDGFRWPASRMNLANAERIEVVKGAAANLYGRIQPGGMINVVTKRPQESPYYAFEQRFGSFDLYRTTLDATGPVMGDGSILYRFNFEYLSKNSFRDFAFTDRKFLAPSLTWKMAERTRLDLDFVYSDEDTQEDYGLVALGRRPANIPISRYLQEPSTDKSNTTLFNTAVTLTHEFDDDWKFRARFDYLNRNTVDPQTYGVALDENPASPGYGTLTRDFYGSFAHSATYYGTVDLTGKFDTWGVGHRVLLGWEHYTGDGQLHTQWDPVDFAGFPINIFHPIYRPSNVNALAHHFQTTDGTHSNGLYFQDQLKFFEKLQILGGGRYDWVSDVNGSSDVSPADAAANRETLNNGRFSPRVGVLYQPVAWLSLYGNYAESMGNASSAIDASGNLLGPEVGEQYEAGFKTAFFDDRLTSTVAFYHLTKKNMVVPVPGTPYSEAIGEARSQGVEIDVSGRLTEALSLIATYAYTDAVILEGRNAGNRLWNVPRNAGSLWAKYDMQNEPLQGLSFGAGVYFQGQKEGDNANSYQLPGYGRIDALISYKVPVAKSRVTLQFNVENLLDHRYYAATLNDRFSVNVGAPRTFLGSLRLEY